MRTEPKYPKQDNAIYCFKIKNKDGRFKVECYIIPEYTSYGENYLNGRFVFDGKKYLGSNYRHDSVRQEQFDRVVNMKLFTFDPDKERAEKIIGDHFLQCVNELQKKLMQSEKNLYMWNGRHRTF